MEEPQCIVEMRVIMLKKMFDVQFSIQTIDASEEEKY